MLPVKKYPIQNSLIFLFFPETELLNLLHLL